MSYQEIYEALHGEQMKKEAGMRKEAWNLGGLLRKAFKVRPTKSFANVRYLDPYGKVYMTDKWPITAYPYQDSFRRMIAGLSGKRPALGNEGSSMLQVARKNIKRLTQGLNPTQAAEYPLNPGTRIRKSVQKWLDSGRASIQDLQGGRFDFFQRGIPEEIPRDLLKRNNSLLERFLNYYKDLHK